MTSRLNTVIATAAVAAVLGGGASLVGDSTEPSSAASSAADATTAYAVADARQKNAFSLLRTPSRPSAPTGKGAGTLADLAAQGATTKDARQIDTAYGAGWLVPAPARDRLCLVLPDPVDGYGITCQPTTEATAKGLVASMVSPDGARPTVLTAVLPDSASKPRIDTGAASTAQRSVDGVVSLVAERNATFRYTTTSGTAEIPVVVKEPRG